PTKLVAVARPHHLVWAGQKVSLDASLSSGRELRFEWTFTEGGTAEGAKVERTYPNPGVYSEIVKVTDGEGRVDYDFQVVHVLDRGEPAAFPPSIHANYAPTLGIRPGDPITFRVRSFRTKEPGETWDFGDGTPPVQVRSDGNADQHAPNGYADAIHKYAKAGHYLVKVENVNARGVRAVARLQVRVGMD
ncbi:MAG TPA: PKD domain-containing protein, partial [Planctomycetota bacterium]|nr:PKD domain-containing protein [Planctomycetota bacterium]